MSLVNTNLQMLKTPTAANSRVAAGEVDVLTLLGNQLNINPELLQENPELAKLIGENSDNLNFETLLGDSLKEGESVEGENVDLLKLQGLKGEKAEATGLAKAEGQVNQNRPLSPFEVKRNAEQEALNNTKSILVNPTEGELGKEVKAQNAEQASKAFIPQRKSIFAVNDKPEVATKAKPVDGLMNLNEFVAKQSPSQKTAIAKNAYKSQMSDSMFMKKIEQDAPKLSGTSTEAPMKITDLMLANDSQGADTASDFMSHSQAPQVQNITATASTPKVFDMAQMQGADQSDVINTIQDYIIQSKVSSEPTVNMSFEHKDLGMIDLTVSKAENNHISVMINSHTKEGSQFFAKNQGELLQSLSQAGVQVSEFKLDTSSNTQQNNQNGQSWNGQGRQEFAGNDRQQRNEDSRRREELWNLFNTTKDAA